LSAEVLRDHLDAGFGGTCYSLTAFMESLLSLSGFDARRFTADMPAGKDMHSALMVARDDKLFLVDPAFLLDEPLPLPDEAGRSARIGNISVERLPEGRIEVYSDAPEGGRKLRYAFGMQPCGEERFVERWLDSFNWSTNRSLLIAKRSGGGLIYMHESHLRVTNRDGSVVKANLKDAVGAGAAERFGLPADAVEKAHAIAQKRKKEAKRDGRKG